MLADRTARFEDDEGNLACRQMRRRGKADRPSADDRNGLFPDVAHCRNPFARRAPDAGAHSNSATPARSKTIFLVISKYKLWIMF